MINGKSLTTVRSQIYKNVFRKPDYTKYCFNNISTTLPALFSSKYTATLPLDVFSHPQKEYQQVVFFFIDAFGWRFLERYKDHPALARLRAKGTISLLTSQFPSTTAAHVTCMNTGLSVGESGVYEWNYYEPKLDAVIQPLPFSYAGDEERETLQKSGVKPSDIFPQNMLYKNLKKMGVTSHMITHSGIANTSYGSVISEGCMMHGYDSLHDAFHLLDSFMKNPKDQQYIYFYNGEIDKVGHVEGLDSPLFDQTVETFLTLLEKWLTQIESTTSDTLFLMTADHGQTRIYPETCWYLNQHAPELIPLLKTTAQGSPIVPAGSPRDMFLHVQENSVDKVVDDLQVKLKDIAEVVRTKELIEAGFFGSIISDVFLSRVGNVVLLPFTGQSTWWYEEGKFWEKYKGHHGGLTPDEMEIGFISCEL